MSAPRLTEDEIVSYLKGTDKPTLLVEDTGDLTVYHWMEERLGMGYGAIYPCGGRTVLLSLYNRRGQFPNAKLVWLADLDMWRFSSPPPDLSGIIFTTGYSIENDIYAGSNIEQLLTSTEADQHRQVLSLLCEWMAFEIGQFRSGHQPEVACSVRSVIDFEAMTLCPNFCKRRNYASPNTAEVGAVKNDYKLSIRGKTLIDALVYFLSDPNRKSKHSKAALVESALKLCPGNEYLARILLDITNQFGSLNFTPSTKR